MCLKGGCRSSAAVAFIIISFSQLKAGKKSGSQHCSIWRSETDRVMLQAVGIIEISFKQLKAGEKSGSQHCPI